MPSYLSPEHWQGKTAQDGRGYEGDPRWDQVDSWTLEQLHPRSRPNSDALVFAIQNSVKHGLPDIQVCPSHGKFMALQTIAGGVTQALELGTLGGYSAIWLASENPSLHVTSCEIDPLRVRVARENIAHAGLQDRVTVIEGPGLETLGKLEEEIQQGKRERFGYVFIDADKENNWNYFDVAVRMSKKGTSIYVDNIVRRGRLVDESQQQTPAVKGAREVVEKAGKDTRVKAVVMQTVAEKNYDGFLMAVVV